MIDKRALAQQYESLSTFELLRIVSDEESYTHDARDIAKLIAWKRLQLEDRFSLEDAIKAEVERVVFLLARCHLCGREDDSYVTTPFRLRKTVGVDRKIKWGDTIGESLLGLAMAPLFGVGRIAVHTERVEHYQVRDLIFQRCRACKAANATIDSIYTRHPLYEFCAAMGFVDLG